MYTDVYIVLFMECDMISTADCLENSFGMFAPAYEAACMLCCAFSIQAA